jgi:Lon protease-like protein
MMGESNYLSESPSLEQLFGGKGRGVKYILDDEPISDMGVENLLFVPSRSSNIKREIREIALMPFETPLFPGSREFLYIYEMRFRSLMNDVETKDKNLGRCFVDEVGIGSVGSLCHIVEKRKLEDGKGFFIIEATSRFRVRKILRSDPYLRAEVEMIDDIDVVGDSELCENLCRDVYAELKAYLRVARYMNADDVEEGDEDENDVLLSPAIRDNRPLRKKRDKLLPTEADFGLSRHKAFSHACANLLSTEPAVMQQLLQSQSVAYRLHGLKQILAEAVEELTSLVVDDDLISADAVAEIRRSSAMDDDDDSDLMPPLEYEGVTLASELDDELIEELGIKESDFVDFESSNGGGGGASKVVVNQSAYILAAVSDTKKGESRSIHDDANTVANIDVEVEVDDSIWGGGGDAFQ